MKKLSNIRIENPINISGSVETAIDALDPMISTEVILDGYRYLEFHRSSTPHSKRYRLLGN